MQLHSYEVPQTPPLLLVHALHAEAISSAIYRSQCYGYPRHTPPASQPPIAACTASFPLLS